MELKNNLKPKVHIDITPLVDVVFILLIFFMVSSTFLELPGMKLELPSAGAARAQPAEQATLFLSREGKILLGKKELSLQELAIILANEASSESLIIKGDKEVAYGLVVKVIDIAKKAGIKNLVIATSFPRPGEKANE